MYYCGSESDMWAMGIILDFIIRGEFFFNIYYEGLFKEKLTKENILES